MVLANYMESFPVDDATGLPTISAGSGYDNVNGSGRITIITSGQSDAAVEHSGNSDIPAASGGVTEYVVLPGDSLWKIAQTCYGSGSCWGILYEANADIIKNPALIYQGQKLRIPDSAEVL